MGGVPDRPHTCAIPAGKGGERDEKNFDAKSPVKGGRFLGEYEKKDKRESRKDMPQVKGLKELSVAGQATRIAIRWKQEGIRILFLPYRLDRDYADAGE